MEKISFYHPKKTMAVVVNRVIYYVVVLSLYGIAAMIVGALVTSFGWSSSPMMTMSSISSNDCDPVPLRVSVHRKNIYISSDLLQAVSSAEDSTSGTFGNRFKNQTVVRKIGNLEREKIERGLAGARAAILSAASNGSFSLLINDTDYVPNGMVYHNPGAFYQSYREMEKRFKVYVYSEGELPIAHDGPCKNLYAIEGRFIHEMEQGPGKFRTKDGESAHVYFMPFSVTWMVKYLYNPNSNFDKNPLRRYVADYVNLVSNRYPFWNRTNGADHFMVACHDWAPQATEGNPLVYNTSIRVLCNANTTEGFNPEKDVSLPEIHLLTGDIPNELVTPPPLDAPRPYLGFFAGGGDHGPIRPVLLKHWKGRDEELQVHEYLPKNMSYHSFMLNSKFCLCPSGYEVASPRVVEAIYAECVPVIMSENYVLPFSDVLNWDAFSIKVEVSDIPRLKEILSAVSEEKYRKLKEGLQVVRKHFVLNQPAQRFDVFHMILHSIWLRRINFGVVHNVA